MAFDLTGVYYYGNTNIKVFNGGFSYGWVDQKYRTIKFLEPPTGDLLKWLQANAVKQGSDTPVDTSS